MPISCPIIIYTLGLLHAVACMAFSYRRVDIMRYHPLTSKNALKEFLGLNSSVHPTHRQKKSPLQSDQAKGSNLHNFKMAAIAKFQCTENFYWCILDPINALPTDIKVMPKCQISYNWFNTKKSS